MLALVAARPAPMAERGTPPAEACAVLAARFQGARVRLFVPAEPAPPGPRAAPELGALALIAAGETSRGPGAPVDPAGLAGAHRYRTERRCLLDGRGHDVAAAPAALVLVALAVRAPALSHAAFDAHWRDVHGPLAVRHHAGTCAYEQLPVLAAETGAPPLDGIALLHFASAADLAERYYDAPAGQRAIRADTVRFLDVARCRAALMREHRGPS